MNVKRYLRRHSPDSLFVLLKFAYMGKNKLRQSFRKPPSKQYIQSVISKIEKYRPYYQDELSLKVLDEREKYITTRDESFFFNSAAQSNNKNYMPTFDIYSTQKYSSVVIIYDDENDPRIERQKLLLDAGEWAGKYKLEKFRKFSRIIKAPQDEYIIALLNGWRDIYLQCYYRGFWQNFTFDLVQVIDEKDQYFDVFEPRDDEIIVDAGAYDGTTALRFLQWGAGKVKKIYSFEFDHENAEKCEENLKPYGDKVTLIKKGTWDKDETIYLNADSMNGSSGSSVNTRKGSIEAHLTSIDNAVQGEKVTFIKMDIEGSELKSLIGARNTIISNKPRLAICAYHKDTDLYELPEYLLSLVPEYKFYLRHYSSTTWETVLYAYCE